MARKKQGVKDCHLILFVIILVLVNAAIVCLQILLEGLVAHFSIATSLNKEMPFRLQGVILVFLLTCFYQFQLAIILCYLFYRNLRSKKKFISISAPHIFGSDI